ncbi:MAG TPA: hypothetical protein VMZ30_17685 [Pyrinomonadaceae bacterium]|nr:hypothetical protein [Pyrinomonadaceae bacterium]
MIEVESGLASGLQLKRCKRAMRILFNLGMFQNDPFQAERQAKRQKRRLRNLKKAQG